MDHFRKNWSVLRPNENLRFVLWRADEAFARQGRESWKTSATPKMDPEYKESNFNVIVRFSKKKLKAENFVTGDLGSGNMLYFEHWQLGLMIAYQQVQDEKGRSNEPDSLSM